MHKINTKKAEMVSLARSNVAQVRDPKPAQTNSHWAQKRSPGVLAVALKVSNWGEENRVSLWVRIYADTCTWYPYFFQYAQYTCTYLYIHRPRWKIGAAVLE